MRKLTPLLGDGFRVYLTTCSVTRWHLNHAQLVFQTPDPGVIIHRGREKGILSDCWLDPEAFISTLLLTILDRPCSVPVAALKR